MLATLAELNNKTYFYFNKSVKMENVRCDNCRRNEEILSSPARVFCLKSGKKMLYLHTMEI